jgi:hypothetical protein
MTAPARHRQTLGVAGNNLPLPAHASGLEETTERPIACPPASEEAGGQTKAGLLAGRGLPCLTMPN